MRLLFLNGWSASENILVKLKASIPETHELLVLDHLYGLELPEIVEKIDRCVCPNTILIGWSLGGMLALYYASARSQRVDVGEALAGVVLLNTPVCFLEKSNWQYGVPGDELQQLKDVVNAGNLEALRKRFSHLLVDGSISHKDDRRFLRQAYAVRMFPEEQVLLKGLVYLEGLDLRDQLVSINCHILGLFGSNDALIRPQSLGVFTERCQRFRGVVVEGMGHLPVGMFAQAVAEHILSFINVRLGSDNIMGEPEVTGKANSGRYDAPN